MTPNIGDKVLVIAPNAELHAVEVVGIDYGYFTDTHGREWNSENIVRAVVSPTEVISAMVERYTCGESVKTIAELGAQKSFTDLEDQIKKCGGFYDELGHSITGNVAYVSLKNKIMGAKN